MTILQAEAHLEEEAEEESQADGIKILRQSHTKATYNAIIVRIMGMSWLNAGSKRRQ